LIKHFVEFLSPGTFFSESTIKEIESWDVNTAIKMSKKITERYNAKPYGFRFFTRYRGPEDLDSEIIKKSGIYFLGGKIETYDEVVKRNDPKESTLRSNMRINNIDRVIVNTNSFKIILPFGKNDVLVK
jgi:hypothetical protein